MKRSLDDKDMPPSKKRRCATTVDLCFLLDCTGSMGSYIAATKDDIQATVTAVSAEHPTVDFNYGFVCYRDWCDGDKRIETFPFNPSLSHFQSFVGGLAATGGGDYAEDVLGGLSACSLLNWSANTRVLFHIFDAAPHGRPRFHDNASDNFPGGHPSDPNLEDIFRSLDGFDVDYYMLKLNNALTKCVGVFLETAARVGYERIQERFEIDVSRVMSDVAEAVLQSMAVRVSRRGRRRRPDARFRPMMKKRAYKVYCGIDFGTHGSAYAFCTPGEPHPRVIQDWGGGSSDVKTLTNLLLGPDQTCVPGHDGFGDAALERYLNMDPEEQQRHYFFRRFKMALYEDALLGEDRDEKTDIARTITAANGKSVKSEKVLEEALKFMVHHVMKQIRAEFEIESPADVQWVVTVPAIWSQRSRKMMERAALRAGIPSVDALIVALEPECASIIAKAGLRLDVGDAYMLVDCGGGTVDIACHELETETDVKEIYQATGGPWGATYIDDEFFNMLGIVFGQDVLNKLDEEVKGDEPSLKEEIVQAFNGAKKYAIPDEASRNVKVLALREILSDVIGSAREINIRLSGATYRGVTGGITYRRGVLTLSRDIWDQLFSVVIDPMIAHIQGLLRIPELNRKLQTLCFVGGFAESAILMERLNGAFPDRRIYRPNKPILSVVQGAAKFGLIPTSIRERRAQATVGIAIRDEWKEETDSERRKIRDRTTHMDCVDGVFFPFIKIGQPVPIDMEPVIHYFEPTNPSHFAIDIYVSGDLEPPRFVPDHPTSKIGPVELPEEYDHDEDILVQFDFSGMLIRVKVQFGSMEPQEVELSWV